MTTLLLPVQLGQYANDGTGDDIRTAFTRVNNSFAALTVNITDAISAGNGYSLISGLTVVGNGQTLSLKSLVPTGSISITSDGETLSINAPAALSYVRQDTNPSLGGSLGLNSHNITGTGNINITGQISASSFAGNITSLGTSSFSNINVSGIVNGGSFIGSFAGPLTGTVSSISNHNLADLGDVDNLSPSTGNILSWNGYSWTPTVPPLSGGNVVGPNFSYTNAIPVYSDTTGKLLKNSQIYINNNGAISAPKQANSIPFYYVNQTFFPAAANVTGALAFSNLDNKLYYADNLGWKELAGQQLKSNLDVNGHTITTSATNGNIILSANGSGSVNITSLLNVSAINSNASLNINAKQVVFGNTINDAIVSFNIYNYPATDLLVSQALNYKQIYSSQSSVPLTFYKSRGNVLGLSTVLANDELGGIRFDGNISSGRIKGASITALVDGTVTSSVMPTSITVTTNNNTTNTWKFGYDGSFTTNVIDSNVIPGKYHFDVTSTSSKITLNASDTVDFHNFSGSVLVNCYNSGTVSQYLCGSGNTPHCLGSSNLQCGSMSSNSGISGYTFTANETGTHTFFVVRTRTGA